MVKTASFCRTELLKATDLTLLSMEQEHIDHVLEIEKISFDLPWNSQMFKEEFVLSYSHHFVLYVENKLGGYICFHTVVDELEILRIAVHPCFRRQGIGTHLMQICFQIAFDHDIDNLFLETPCSNSQAIEFYQQLGFTVIGKRPNYYQSYTTINAQSIMAQDAVVMRNSLKKTKNMNKEINHGKTNTTYCR
ncbi:MAG: ribosomal protein S18-alanine N-acetyltransferase [Desulfobacterales bacterium]|nr:ribosomal protein S18-alanine N-acetyltransferase [Desulfobacterales bacterium]